LARDSRQLDEDDVRSRANPRGTRPRSKQRPMHADAAAGRVLGVDRGRFGVLVEDVEITAMRARELGRTPLDERETVLRRTADDNDPQERVIVANADQLVIVSALANPDPSYGFIDRCVVAALAAGIEPLLCLTKSDLATPEAVLERYRPLDVPAIVTRKGGSLDELRGHLVGHESVFVGHSGVGKSTLINALVPTADRATAVVSAIGKGRHTSSSAIALRLPDGAGWVIDTPGVRSFGLAHVTADDLLWAFPDLEDGAVQCLSGCEHLSVEAGCHLDAWVAEGHSTPARLAAFRRLLVSR
jgi:ribosome biogenesis GTPase / thiamine phosphate phosphatase